MYVEFDSGRPTQCRIHGHLSSPVSLEEQHVFLRESFRSQHPSLLPHSSQFLIAQSSPLYFFWYFQWITYLCFQVKIFFKKHKIFFGKEFCYVQDGLKCVISHLCIPSVARCELPTPGLTRISLFHTRFANKSVVSTSMLINVPKKIISRLDQPSKNPH